MPRSQSVAIRVPASPVAAISIAAAPTVAVARMDAVPVYGGDYVITPGDGSITIPCKGRRMASDLVIEPVPASYGRISWNGVTLSVF